MHIKASIFLIILALLLASCNLPIGNEPATPESSETPSVNALGTAVELTTVARMTELAGTVVASATEAPAVLPTETSSPTATATPCGPIVTASTVANIRSGPDTAYQVVGSLPENGVAKIAGRNDANTWWYIEFSGGVGGHAWIAGSVVTVSCVPEVVQVVAAPPFPTAAPTATVDTSLPPPVAGTPDLVANGMQWWPNPGKKNQPMSIQVKVTNNGSAPAGQFTVAWLSNQTEPGCSWTVSGLGIGESKNLDCEFTYTYQPASTSSFWITLVVDSSNQISESNEGNNKREEKITVEP